MDNKDNNKSAWNEPFYKERNIGKCLSVGVSLISNRFIKIVKLAAPAIAVSAIIFTVVTLAFCNAGFDLMGVQSEYSSFTHFVGDTWLNLVIMLLSILRA